MRTLQNFARVLVAPIFIFSGFVKAIDPLGSTYKFSDYFEAFGLDFLMPLAFVLAILLSTAELVIGLNLLLGVFMRVTAWALMIFMSFFTVLTLVIALTDPVSDCGCFGDALILTNWQTFWKNIVIMVPTLIVFLRRFSYKPLSEPQNEWGIVTLFIAVGVIISVTCYNNLPFIDFRPYKVGTHIPSDMSIPEDAEMDVYESTFIYEKQGKQQEFTADEIPYEDTNWKFIDAKSVLIKKGYEPPIHDFSLASVDGIDITDSLLNSNGYSFLVVCHKLEKANLKGLEKVNGFVGQVKDKADVFGLTASISPEIKSVSNEVGGFNYNYFATDEITLKTVVRSNPGLVLIKDGTIVGKWHYKNLPEVKEDTNLLSLATQVREGQRSNWVVAFFLTALIGVMIFLVLLVKQD